MSTGVQPGPGELAAVAAARKRLEDEQRRLGAIIAGLEGEGLRAETGAESIAEIASVSQHPADTASETFERERDLTLLEEATGALADVDRAIAKLATGEYGICERCHRPIDPDRLEARPAARFCLAHEERYEMGGPHLVELTATGGAAGGAAPPARFDEEDFLAADDELEPSEAERTDGPEFGAVGARGDAELADDELGEELASAGLLEDEMGEGLIDLQLEPDEVDEELEADELEAEELEEAELEGAAAGEGVEEEEEEALSEDVEASLDELLRIQFGLGEEAPEEAELAEEPLGGEEQPPVVARRADEFLCTSCFQLKHRSLLADPAGGRCVDCANSDRA